MIIHLSTTAQNWLADAFADLIDSGGAAGYFELYDGAMPADGNTAIGAQVKLGTMVFSYPCAPNAVAGLLTFAAITQDASADATGTAAWARFYNSAGTKLLDCDATLVAGSGMVKLNTLGIVITGPISVLSATWQQPAS